MDLGLHTPAWPHFDLDFLSVVAGGQSESAAKMDHPADGAVPGGLGQRAVFVCDHEAKNIYTNSAYQSMTGTTPDELLGLGWISFVHPDDLPVSLASRFTFAVRHLRSVFTCQCKAARCVFPRDFLEVYRKA